MLRKLLCAMLFVLLPTLCWADTYCNTTSPSCCKPACCKPSCWWEVPRFKFPCCMRGWGTGPYIGGGIGADTVDLKYSAYIQTYLVPPGVTTLTSDADLVNDVIQRNEIATQGFLSTAYAGYSVHCNNLYLAGEVNGDWSTAFSTDENLQLLNDNLSKTTRKIDRMYGVSALPGIEFPCCTALIYGRIGYMRGRYIVDTSDPSLANVRTWLNGIRYGGGIEKRIWRGLSLRMDYSHIVYRNRPDLVINVTPSPTADTSINFKRTVVSPKQNLFELDLTYRFC